MAKRELTHTDTPKDGHETLARALYVKYKRADSKRAAIQREHDEDEHEVDQRLTQLRAQSKAADAALGAAVEGVDALVETRRARNKDLKELLRECQTRRKLADAVEGGPGGGLSEEDLDLLHQPDEDGFPELYITADHVDIEALLAAHEAACKAKAGGDR
jgi:hypothetical protein